MSMEYIRKTYGVPAMRGGRIEYSGKGFLQTGTIKSAKNGRLKVLMDGDKNAGSYHPTWNIRYIV